jgi:hypothetical protein
MNYLKLILRFWKLRRSKRITNLQADLYFYLIQECNERDWENPFECANKLICGSITISEPSLIDARNRLQQLGLIEFNSGKRNEKSPIYFIVESESNLTSNLNFLSRNQVNTLVESLDETEEKAPPIKEQTKRKQKPKQNQTSFPPQADVEKKVATMFWEKFVAEWFSFYEQKFSIAPTFNGQSAKSLKFIVETIEKAVKKTDKQWTEEFAVTSLRHFLQLAYSDEWLKQNFLLNNLASKFDSIIQKRKNGNNQTGQPATGGNVSTSSIFNAINAMPD